MGGVLFWRGELKREKRASERLCGRCCTVFCVLLGDDSVVIIRGVGSWESVGYGNTWVFYPDCFMFSFKVDNGHKLPRALGHPKV